MVYGPKQDENRLIPITINSFLKKKVFHCSDGKQARDFLYIDDLVNALIKSLDNPNIIGKSINLGYGKVYKVNYVINYIHKNKIWKTNIWKISLRKDEIKSLYPNIKLAKLLDWEPQTSFKRY